MGSARGLTLTMGNKKFTISFGAGRVHKLLVIKDLTKTDASDVFVRVYLMSYADEPIYRFRVFPEPSANAGRRDNINCIRHKILLQSGRKKNNNNNNCLLFP